MWTLEDRLNMALKRAAPPMEQQDLAARLGVNKTWITGVKKGRWDGGEKLEQAAKMLGVDPQWLAYGSGLAPSWWSGDPSATSAPAGRAFMRLYEASNRPDKSLISRLFTAWGVVSADALALLAKPVSDSAEGWRAPEAQYERIQLSGHVGRAADGSWGTLSEAFTPYRASSGQSTMAVKVLDGIGLDRYPPGTVLWLDLNDAGQDTFPRFLWAIQTADGRSLVGALHLSLGDRASFVLPDGERISVLDCVNGYPVLARTMAPAPNPAITIQSKGPGEIPVVGTATASDGSSWGLALDHPEGYRWKKGRMLVRVTGDSAYPVAFAGQFVVVEPDRPVRHNNMVLIQFADGRAMLKRWCADPKAPGGGIYVSVNAGLDSPWVDPASVTQRWPVVGVLFE